MIHASFDLPFKVHHERNAAILLHETRSTYPRPRGQTLAVNHEFHGGFAVHNLSHHFPYPHSNFLFTTSFDDSHR
jgi:hypothetical protein